MQTCSFSTLDVESLQRSEAYLTHSQKGVYYCTACDAPLFGSDQKFSADGSPCPSFRSSISQVETRVDYSFGLERTAVFCKCGQPLGHLYQDGKEGGDKNFAAKSRYCVFSASLKFRTESEKVDPFVPKESQPVSSQKESPGPPFEEPTKSINWKMVALVSVPIIIGATFAYVKIKQQQQ